MADPKPSRFLTVHQLVEESGYDDGTIYRLIASGDLPCVRATTNSAHNRTRIKVLREDWEAWIQRHRSPATAPTPTTNNTKRRGELDLPGAELFR